MDINQVLAYDAVGADWRYIVLHHSDSESGSLESLESLHRQRRDQFGMPWEGIGYHFVVGNGQGMLDGRVVSTYRWRQQLHGAHTRSPRHNRRGIGICLIGDFELQAPTPRQLASTRKLIETLVTRFDIARHDVLRHSDVAATRCPGRLLPFEELVAPLSMAAAVPAGVH